MAPRPRRSTKPGPAPCARFVTAPIGSRRMRMVRREILIDGEPARACASPRAGCAFTAGSLHAPGRTDPLRLSLGARGRSADAGAGLGAAPTQDQEHAAADRGRRARSRPRVQRMGVGWAARSRGGGAGAVGHLRARPIARAHLRLALADLDPRRIVRPERRRHLVGPAGQLGRDRAETVVRLRRPVAAFFARLVRRLPPGPFLPADRRPGARCCSSPGWIASPSTAPSATARSCSRRASSA